jgi:hypothetical protein
MMRQIPILLLVLSMLVDVTNGYASEMVTITPPKFSLKSLIQDIGTQQIVLEFVVSGGDHVVPILYMPKVASPNTLLDVSENPCAGSERDKLCCLRSMVGMYDLDVTWESKLNLAVMQSCNSSSNPVSSNSPTVFGGSSIFPGSLANSTVLQGGSDFAIPGVEYSYDIKMIDDDPAQNETVLTFKLATTYVEPRSKVTDVGLGSYKYEFFVGIVFATLRESSSDIYTTVMQQHIEFTRSEFGFYAVGTEQDRSLIKQVETFIHQGKNPATVVNGVPDPGGELMQYVEVNIDFNPFYITGTRSVKVMTDTMKFSKRSSVPQAVSEWSWPCTNPLADSFYTNQSSAWTDLFLEACLPEQPTFCTDIISNGRFFIPFNLDAATTNAGFINGINTGLSLFVVFEIVFMNSAQPESPMTSTVYATVNLNAFPVLEHCEDAVLDYKDITDTVDISVELGTGPPTGTGLTETTLGANKIINKMTTPAASYGSAVISLVVDGLAYSADYSTKFHVDNLMIFNFLGVGNTDFEDVMNEITAGTGLTIQREGGDDYFTITPTFSGLSCDEALPVNNGINCLWRRAVVKDVVAATSTESLYYLSSATPTAASATWVRTAFFPEDNDDVNADKFLQDHCPKAYATDDGGGGTNPALYESADEGAYGCIFIDPGYRWISRGGNSINNPHMISDKTIVLAVVTVKPQDYSGGSTRRLLSMNSDGSDMKMHPLSTFGMGPDHLRTGIPIPTNTLMNHVEVVDPGMMRSDLMREYARMNLSNPPVVTAREMHIHLKARFAATHPSNIKIKDMGNTALSRKLLGVNADADGAHNRILNESASQCLVVENDFVCPECNIAYMFGYDEAPAWRMIESKIHLSPGVSIDTFKANTALVLREYSTLMVGGAVEGRLVGLTSTSPTAQNRRLLEVTSHNGVSTTVDLEAIFKMDAEFGELFLHMFKCIMQATAMSPINITIPVFNETVVQCGQTENALDEVGLVQTALLTRCGIKDQKLSDDVCNKLYQTLILTAPSVAFDWYSLRNGELPKLAFTMKTTTGIVPGDDAEIIYKIRTIIASVLLAPMDRVLVEIREQQVLATQLVLSRRLLTEPRDMVIFVWIYAGGTGFSVASGFTDPIWPPVGTTDLHQFYTDYSAAMKLALVNAGGLDGLVLSTVAETSDFTVMPFTPLLHEYSVTLTVDFNVNRTNSTKDDMAVLTTAIKVEFAKALEVPETDIRILSIDVTLDASRPAIAVEIRIPTDDEMMRVAKYLRSTDITLDADLHKNIKAKNHFADVGVVTIRRSSVKGTKDTVTVSAKEGTDVGLIIGIIAAILVVLIVMGVVIEKYVVHPSGSAKPEQPYSAPADQPAGVNGGPAGMQSYMHPHMYQPQYQQTYSQPYI